MFLANFFELKFEKKIIKKYFELMDDDNNGELSFNELVKSFEFKVFINFN